MRKFLYTGRSFYESSQTMLGILYETTPQGYERTDWGLIEGILDKGDSVEIRKAKRHVKLLIRKQHT